MHSERLVDSWIKETFIWVLATRADFVIQYHQSLWYTPQLKAISECRQKKFSQAEIQSKRSGKVALKPVRQTLVWCG